MQQQPCYVEVATVEGTVDDERVSNNDQWRHQQSSERTAIDPWKQDASAIANSINNWDDDEAKQIGDNSK